MNERYICIHGHFYQPPRENPWLEAIEQQDSAYPYHDWNERITEECYASNGAARILNDNKRISKIVNNYANISFNFGPTLLSWLEKNSPTVYQSILNADRDSQARFAGHGNAIAQAYNHMIMPLANARDKYTQIFWGIRDFNQRFQRQPEGMWLPETAVDNATLALMAEQGITFTILAQHQAKRMRKIGETEWQNFTDHLIDPTQPYLVQLPNGRSITVFFYDGKVSQEIAFSRLLSQGEQLAERITEIFSSERSWPQLAHIATDGETYGHHHAHGDMALAYALHFIETKQLAKLINYGAFLAQYPPTYEAEIVENSSWSCAHGIERWRAACGCNSGQNANWRQEWRTPLRAALDWLRDTLVPLYEQHAQPLLSDPWLARNDYIDVVLDRSEASMQQFFATHANHELSAQEIQTALFLLEMQRYAMLMYTSCGWFFDELSGIETVQIISYAARALQLAQAVGNENLEQPFLEKLALAKSNLKKYQDGRCIYERLVKPSMLNWLHICAHYAINSLFEHYEKTAPIYCYEVICDDLQYFTTGNVQLVAGTGRFTSTITTESADLSFVAVHFGDQNINCGVCESTKIDYVTVKNEIVEVFNRADLVGVLSLLNTYFGRCTYSIGSLFHDEQRNVVRRVLKNTLKEVEAIYIQLYQRHASLIRFIEELHIPLPESFRATAEHVINAQLREAFAKEKFKIKHIEKLLEEAKRAKIPLKKIMLAFTLQKSLERMACRFKEQPQELALLEYVSTAVQIANHMPFHINLFHIQNCYYDLLQTFFLEQKKRAEQGDAAANTWVEQFIQLGTKLSMQVP